MAAHWLLLLRVAVLVLLAWRQNGTERERRWHVVGDAWMWSARLDVGGQVKDEYLSRLLSLSFYQPTHSLIKGVLDHFEFYIFVFLKENLQYLKY